MIVLIFFFIQGQRLVSREDSRTNTSVNFSSEGEKLNLRDGKMDLMVKLEINSEKDPSLTKSWPDVDEKYGRVVAFQVSNNNES